MSEGGLANHYHSFCYIIIASENVANQQTRSKKCDGRSKSRWKNYDEPAKSRWKKCDRLQESRWKNVYLLSDNTSYYVEKED